MRLDVVRACALGLCASLWYTLACSSPETARGEGSATSGAPTGGGGDGMHSHAGSGVGGGGGSSPSNLGGAAGAAGAAGTGAQGGMGGASGVGGAAPRPVALPEDIEEKLSRHNVVFTTAGRATIESRDSMPLGNGDLAANVWAREDGDLVFYLAKSDAWSETGRLLKLGRVRLSFSPNPFAKGLPFRQELSLSEGAIRFTAGEAGSQVRVKVWIDAARPMMTVEASSDRAVTFKAWADPWRTRPIARDPAGTGNYRSFIGVEARTKETPTEAADVFLSEPGRVGWYHRNETSLYREMLEYQKMLGYADRYPDPYLGLTWGAVMEGDGLIKQDPYTLAGAAPTTQHVLRVHAHTSQPARASDWGSAMSSRIAENRDAPAAEAWSQHVARWHEFWGRSWIFASGSPAAENVTRGYLLQRFQVACMGRGRHPVKFNGGLFTMPNGAVNGDDFRDWGSMYWHQNTRLVYWPLVAAGDWDLLQPYFDLYRNTLSLRKDISRDFFAIDGGAWYPEQMYFYGGDGTRDKLKWAVQGTPDWTTFHWSNGFEALVMMLDTWALSGNDALVRDYILPISSAILRFYKMKYLQPSGRLRISPSNALETHWNSTNPMDHVAGLHYLLARLRALPMALAGAEARAEWAELTAALPAVPVDAMTKRLRAAETFTDAPRNIENPELYAVFPYRLYGIGKPDLELARASFEQRRVKRDGCWYQDGVQAAQLGLTDVALRNVTFGLSNRDPQSRFPGYWAKGNDEVPDFDNGGQASVALQRMLLQSEGREMRVLPAWPKGWDVDFKLWAADQTNVRVVWQGESLTHLSSNRPERLEDVVMP